MCISVGFDESTSPFLPFPLCVQCCVDTINKIQHYKYRGNDRKGKLDPSNPSAVPSVYPMFDLMNLIYFNFSHSLFWSSIVFRGSDLLFIYSVFNVGFDESYLPTCSSLCVSDVGFDGSDLEWLFPWLLTEDFGDAVHFLWVSGCCTCTMSFYVSHIMRIHSTLRVHFTQEL